MTSIFAATAGTRSTSRQRYELAGSDPICAARCSVQHRVAGSVRSGVDLFRLTTASGFGRRTGSCRQYLCRYCCSRRRDDVPASSPPDDGEVATPAATLERPPVLCLDVFVCVVAVAVFCCSSRASSASAENGPLPDHCGNGAAASVSTDDLSMAEPGIAPEQLPRAAWTRGCVRRYSVVAIEKQARTPRRIKPTLNDHRFTTEAQRTQRGETPLTAC